MKNEVVNNMISSLADFQLPRYAEITNVGLYLEQTVKFINYYLAPLEGSGITSSMVSNYVKQKLIANPDKKQYYTDHIAYLMFIAITKAVVSLDDIRIMIGLQQERYTTQKAYDYFCDKFEELMQSACMASPPVDMTGDSPSDAKDLLNTALKTVVSKIYLDKYLAMFRDQQPLT